MSVILLQWKYYLIMTSLNINVTIRNLSVMIRHDCLGLTPIQVKKKQSLSHLFICSILLFSTYWKPIWTNRKSQSTQLIMTDWKKMHVLTWMMMSRQIPAPISEGSPYMPVITYTMACPMVMIIPNTENHQQWWNNLQVLLSDIHVQRHY